MKDLDVERKDKDNKNNNRNTTSNRDNKYRDNSRKWWIGAIIAVVLIIILLMVLNDRTDFTMDDEPVDEPTALIIQDAKSEQMLKSISDVPEKIEFL